MYLNNLDLQKQWLDKGQLPVLVTKRVLRKKGPPLRLVELRRSYLSRICARRPYDQRGGIFSTIRENVYGFARKVPSASEPKARVTSAR
jgi:hypothetical protein